MKTLRFVLAKQRPPFLEEMTLYLINDNGNGSIILNAGGDQPPMEIKNANWFGIKDRPNYVASANSLEELRQQLDLPDPQEPQTALATEAVEFLEYEDRELLRVTEQPGLIFIEKLGGFSWSEGFKAFDDDQVCFDTPNGQWTLTYPAVEQIQEMVQKDPVIISRSVSWASTTPFDLAFPEADVGDLVTTSVNTIQSAYVVSKGVIRITPTVGSGTVVIYLYKV